jgi:hypothetical protein
MRKPSCILYCLLSTKKKHVTIASGFQSKMKVKNIANLVSFLVSSHWSPSQRNIWISRPPTWALLQTIGGIDDANIFYAKIVTDITTLNLERCSEVCMAAAVSAAGGGGGGQRLEDWYLLFCCCPNSEKIWKLWKKDKLNREMIWKIQKKIVKWYGKYGWNVKWYGKYGRKVRLNNH